MAGHIYDASTREVGAGGSESQSHPVLYSEFRPSLTYRLHEEK